MRMSLQRPLLRDCGDFSSFFIPPACKVGTYLVTYTTITVHDRDGGRIWWRYVVHASRELTSGESSGGSKVSTDGCSSTTRRQARPMPNSSPTVPGVAGRCSGRLLGQRPLPYFPRLTSITCWYVPASIVVDFSRVGAQPQRDVLRLHRLSHKEYPPDYPRGHGDGTEEVEVENTSLLTSCRI